MTEFDAPTPKADAEWSRLHPITLLQRFILSLPGFAAVLLATYRSPDSANWASLIATILYAVVALPLIYLRYARFRYRITEKELVIQSGVLTRQHRNIPLEKIQNVSVVQRLLPRLTSTASVQVVTAGSTTAEGVLEFVSLGEARRIREIVRAYKRVGGAVSGTVETPEPEATVEDERQLLLRLGIGRVLLSGAFRFSLLYIAIIFSLLQFFQPDPEVMTQWLLQERYDPFVAAVRAAPAIAAFIAVLAAALLSWFSGIVVNLNKFYGFTLWDEKDKVAKRTGLLTVSERSIPKRRIQAVIVKSNPVMSAFDWFSANVQMIGHDVNQQGHAVVAPFVRWSEFDEIRRHLTSVSVPAELRRVSVRRAGRLATRYTAAVVAVTVALYFVWDLWWTPLCLVPPLLLLAWLQWRAHMFGLSESGLVVRRGVVKKQMWMLPYNKMQVFYTMQSIFQRRRDLRSVHVDTAGASAVSNVTIHDLRTEDAAELLETLYSRFTAHTK